MYYLWDRDLNVIIHFHFFIIMDKHIIGENAGKLWRLLSNDQRRWEYSEIKEALNFDDAELGSAIGWLAHENKIQFELEHHESKDQKAFMYVQVNVYI